MSMRRVCLDARLRVAPLRRTALLELELALQRLAPAIQGHCRREFMDLLGWIVPAREGSAAALGRGVNGRAG